MGSLRVRRLQQGLPVQACPRREQEKAIVDGLLNCREVSSDSFDHPLDKLPLQLQRFLQAVVGRLWMAERHDGKLSYHTSSVFDLGLNPRHPVLCRANKTAKVVVSGPDFKVKVGKS
jgi:hypothetical protein